MWAWQVRGDTLTVARIFRARTVEEFVQRGMRGYCRHSRATIRSTLWRVLETRRARRSERTSPSDRSLAADRAVFGRRARESLGYLALGQGTAHRRLDAMALLALGCGAGLSTMELLAVTVEDLKVDVRGNLAVGVRGTRSETCRFLTSGNGVTRILARAPRVSYSVRSGRGIARSGHRFHPAQSHPPRHLTRPDEDHVPRPTPCAGHRSGPSDADFGASQPWPRWTDCRVLPPLRG